MKKKLNKLKAGLKSALGHLNGVLKGLAIGIAATIGVSALIFFAAVKGPQLHGDYLRYKVGMVVVKVVKDGTARSGGTGSHVQAKSGATYILTNDHVCSMSDDGDVLVVSPDGKRQMPRRIIERLKSHDLCLVEGMPGYSGIKLASSAAQIGEIIAVIGHPLLEPLTISRGEMLGNQKIILLVKPFPKEDECTEETYKKIELPTMFGMIEVCVRELEGSQTTAATLPGSSGSPAVNWKGDLIGVIFAGNNRSNNGFFVPFDVVKSFLASY